MVTNISLRNTGLHGSLPESLGFLGDLKSLVISYNSLTGIIPYSFFKLSMLAVLQLNSNQLTGSIPTSLGSLFKLEQFWVSHNDLVGVISSSFCLSPSLADLRVNSSGVVCYDNCFASLNKSLVTDFLGTGPTALTVCSNLASSSYLSPFVTNSFASCHYPQQPDPSTWSRRDYCTFYQLSKCPVEAVALYTEGSCLPSCLAASPGLYCEVFLLFALECGAENDRSTADVFSLYDACLASIRSTTFTTVAVPVKFHLDAVDL